MIAACLTAALKTVQPFDQVRHNGRFKRPRGRAEPGATGGLCSSVLGSASVPRSRRPAVRPLVPTPRGCAAPGSAALPERGRPSHSEVLCSLRQPHNAEGKETEACLGPLSLKGLPSALVLCPRQHLDAWPGPTEMATAAWHGSSSGCSHGAAVAPHHTCWPTTKRDAPSRGRKEGTGPKDATQGGGTCPCRDAGAHVPVSPQLWAEEALAGRLLGVPGEPRA